MYAYDLTSKARVEAKEFDLESVKGNILRIWSDGEHMWVADSVEDKIYAYRMEEGFFD